MSTRELKEEVKAYVRETLKVGRDREPSKAAVNQAAAKVLENFSGVQGFGQKKDERGSRTRG